MTLYRIHRLRSSTFIFSHRSKRNIRMASAHPQDAAYAASISDPDKFWAHQADQLTWAVKPKTTCRRTTKNLKSGTSHQHWQWFPDGEISTSYNCVTRQVEAGHGDRTAIIWESPVTKTKEKITWLFCIVCHELFFYVL